MQFKSTQILLRLQQRQFAKYLVPRSMKSTSSADFPKGSRHPESGLENCLLIRLDPFRSVPFFTQRSEKLQPPETLSWPFETTDHFQSGTLYQSCSSPCIASRLRTEPLRESAPCFLTPKPSSRGCPRLTQSVFVSCCPKLVSYLHLRPHGEEQPDCIHSI